MTDVLIFVEDPGAANYVAHLPEVLQARGITVEMVVAGAARLYLLERGIRFEPVEVNTTAEFLLVKFSPRLVLVGTAENIDTLGLKLIAQAREHGIESIGVVDALSNAEHRFRGCSDSPLAFAPDWLLLPDEWTQAAFVALGYPFDRALVCGHPYYDYVLQVKNRLDAVGRANLRKQNFPYADGRFMIVFAAEISEGVNGQLYKRDVSYTLGGLGGSTRRTEIVLEEFLGAVALVSPRPYLILRLHPKNTLEEFQPYLNQFDEVSQGGDPHEMIYAADLIVGMTTLLLFEAALFGRPTLSIVPRVLEREWLSSVRSGVTPCATTSDEVCRMLIESMHISVPKSILNVISDSQKQVVNFIEDRLQSSVTKGI